MAAGGAADNSGGNGRPQTGRADRSCIGVEPDHAVALRWYIAAAASGDTSRRDRIIELQGAAAGNAAQPAGPPPAN